MIVNMKKVESDVLMSCMFYYKCTHALQLIKTLLFIVIDIIIYSQMLLLIVVMLFLN